jgi:hypothetical protein
VPRSPEGRRPASRPAGTATQESGPTGQLPITTRSAQAREAFLRGRDLFENSRPGDAVPELKRADHSAAVDELRRAGLDDSYLAWQLLRAQERAGDHRSAARTRSRILAEPRLDPLYLLVRARAHRTEGARRD